MPKPYRLDWTPFAGENLNEIIEFLVSANPLAAERVLEEMSSQTAMLEYMPDTGRE
jgi:plasmid stabilization system protein ParE